MFMEVLRVHIATRAGCAFRDLHDGATGWIRPARLDAGQTLSDRHFLSERPGPVGLFLPRHRPFDFHHRSEATPGDRALGQSGAESQVTGENEVVQRRRLCNINAMALAETLLKPER